MCDKTKTEFNFDVEKYTQTDKQTKQEWPVIKWQVT